MAGIELKARNGRLVHVRPTGRVDEEDAPVVRRLAPVTNAQWAARHQRERTRWHRPAGEPSLLAGAGILASFAAVFGLLAVAFSGAF